MKFLDIITEEKSRSLDNPFYRRILNILSQKFDLEQMSHKLKDPNKKGSAVNLISRYSVLKDKAPDGGSYHGIYLYLLHTFHLNQDDIRLILFLLHRNIDVKDFLNDPLDTSIDFLVTRIFYYEDEIYDKQDDEVFDCERCGGSGWEYEECSQCDGSGKCDEEGIGGDLEGEVKCDDCEGTGEESYDCSNCGGDCQIITERWFAELDRRQMIVISEEELPEPADKEEFLEWYEDIKSDDLQIVADYVYDTEREEIDPDGDPSTLEEERGTIDRLLTYKIEDREALIKFAQFYL